MSGKLACAAALLGALALGSGCRETVREAPAAPLQQRAEIVIEPPQLRIGETAWVELAVVTEPDRQLRPVASPGEIPGLWILDVEALPVEREPGRWIHRTRYQIRARETGRFVWPSQSLEIEADDGELTHLDVAARTLEVVAVSAEFPGRREPFGWRRARPGAPPRAPWAAALAGALAALAGVGLIVLVRRVAALERRVAPAADDAAATWRPTQAALAEAAERAEADPIAAADRASAALRLYLTRRFAIPAISATTEELAARSVPFGLTTRWPDLLALLRRLDATRFRPAEPTNEVRAAIRDAQRFVREAAGPGAREQA